MTITPIFRDYPIPIWEEYPELVLLFFQIGILLAVICIFFFLPDVMSWIDNLEKEHEKERKFQRLKEVLEEMKGA